MRAHPGSVRLEALAAIEGLVFVLTSVFLILTIILQVVAVIMGVNKSDTPGTVHLFDHKDNSDNTP